MANVDRKWQRALLPYMQGVIILLTAFYLIASYLQFSFFVDRIEKPSDANLKQFLGNTTISKALNDSLSIDEKKWIAQCFFESYVVEARQQNAEFLMMSRTWIKYLGFITGVILSIVGAVFVLGKLNNENTTALEGGTSNIKFALQSHSPGIIMAVLGTALIISTILTHQNIEKTDAAVYFNSYNPSLRDLSPAQMKELMEDMSDSTLHQQPDSAINRPEGF
jgi:hypothetical protein